MCQEGLLSLLMNGREEKLRSSACVFAPANDVSKNNWKKRKKERKMKGEVITLKSSCGKPAGCV